MNIAVGETPFVRDCFFLADNIMILYAVVGVVFVCIVETGDRDINDNECFRTFFART